MNTQSPLKSWTTLCLLALCLCGLGLWSACGPEVHSQPNAQAQLAAPPPPQERSPRLEGEHEEMPPPQQPAAPNGEAPPAPPQPVIADAPSDQPAAPPAKPTPTPSQPANNDAPATREPSAAKNPTPSQEPLTFLDFVATHCLVDELGRTEYADGWMDWYESERDKSFLPPDAPKPARGTSLPAPGSQAARDRAARLREEWRKNPTSHIVDCRGELKRRNCPECTGRGGTSFYYGLYLPEAIIRNPDQIKIMLTLVPGGNGGRTRYFTTPIPNKNILQKKSGGLEIKRRLDEYMTQHPDAVPPIVIAADGSGFLSANGPVEFLSHDLPMHVAQTFLGRSDLNGMAIGAEGISSGSKSMMFTLRAKPDTFHTVGLTCMHCRRFNGIDPQKDLGTVEERAQWLQTLARRKESGLLHVRFSVGNLDNQWPCNKEFHDLFAQSGVLQNTPPVFTECREGKQDSKHCDTTWDGFYLFDGRPHHYGLLLDSWEPQLKWHLDTLNQVARDLANR
jgi:hypothetical protein